MVDVIAPTVGRVVWYWDGPKEPAKQPLAAIVAYVFTDRMVNLMVIDPNGISSNRTSVHLAQPIDETPEGAHAEWMPFQVGQAARCETKTG